MNYYLYLKKNFNLRMKMNKNNFFKNYIKIKVNHYIYI